MELQRDTALRNLEKITQILQYKEAENAALTARYAPQDCKSKSHTGDVCVSPQSRLEEYSCDWVPCGGLLTDAEFAFSKGANEEAIGMLTILEQVLMDAEGRINATLLKAKALASLSNHDQALHAFHAARDAADAAERPDLRLKVYFHAGIYHYERGAYATALLAFACATQCPGHERELNTWKQKAQAMVEGQLSGMSEDE